MSMRRPHDLDRITGTHTQPARAVAGLAHPGQIGVGSGPRPAGRRAVAGAVRAGRPAAGHPRHQQQHMPVGRRAPPRPRPAAAAVAGRPPSVPPPRPWARAADPPRSAPGLCTAAARFGAAGRSRWWRCRTARAGSGSGRCRRRSGGGRRQGTSPPPGRRRRRCPAVVRHSDGCRRRSGRTGPRTPLVHPTTARSAPRPRAALVRFPEGHGRRRHVGGSCRGIDHLSSCGELSPSCLPTAPSEFTHTW
jgi:hypothetical protein